jgi:hypothetical protein
MEHADQSENPKLQEIALRACLMVAELEDELIAHPAACVVDHETAANIYFLAQVPEMTATEAGLYMQSIEGWRVD